MNDIAITTKDLSLPLHEAAVSDVLQVAKDNSLFFKLSKSVFHASAIDYLRVILENAIPEDIRNSRAAVVEGNVQADVLHRVLYPQVHVNGIKKKKKY